MIRIVQSFHQIVSGVFPPIRHASSSLRRLLALALALENHDLLLLEELRQVTALVHGHEDVAPADELLVDVELGDSGPVRVLLDAGAQLGVLEDVEGGEGVGVDALQAEDLDGGAGEAAGRGLGGALHEEDDGGGGDGLVDGGASLIGEEAGLEGAQEGLWSEGRGCGRE